MDRAHPSRTSRTHRSAIALVLVAGSLPATVRAQWQIENSNTTADLRGIDNVGGGVAWASGTNGTVLRTEDGGYVWQRCSMPPGAEKLDFRGIQAFDANTAIVMSSGKGDLSRLYKTTDGCQTWKLVFTNPDEDGFWDAVGFCDLGATSTRQCNRNYGVVVGDPTNGDFAIFETRDGGEHWEHWNQHDPKHPPKAVKDESLFAASNEAAVVPGSNSRFAFVTGGSDAHLYFDQPHSSFLETRLWWTLSARLLGFSSGQSSGAFALAARRYPNSFMADFMVVGGDYGKPEEPGQSAFLIGASGLSWSNYLSVHRPETPPHGYRSAVAYDAASKTWITVGPNGTDISTDDGRNWRALKPDPARHEAPDADRNWNALSLPFVVGPKGRIGKLNEAAVAR